MSKKACNQCPVQFPDAESQTDVITLVAALILSFISAWSSDLKLYAHLVFYRDQRITLIMLKQRKLKQIKNNNSQGGAMGGCNF